jgi:hypothetical protein
VIDPHIPHRHHDAIKFPDGKRVLVTQLVEGQRVTVLQLPVTSERMPQAQVPVAANENDVSPIPAA